LIITALAEKQTAATPTMAAPAQGGSRRGVGEEGWRMAMEVLSAKVGQSRQPTLPAGCSVWTSGQYSAGQFEERH
jgi:hypothetical protein